MPSTTASNSGDWAAHAPSSPVVSAFVFQTVSTVVVPSVPPARTSPSETLTATAPARGSGSAAASSTVHSAGSEPSVPRVRLYTVLVGLPSGPLPPMTYIVLPMTADAASERGSGSDGPAAHASRLPVPTALEKYTSATGAEPSEPPA